MKDGSCEDTECCQYSEAVSLKDEENDQYDLKHRTDIFQTNLNIWRINVLLRCSGFLFYILPVVRLTNKIDIYGMLKTRIQKLSIFPLTSLRNTYMSLFVES